MPQNVQYVTLSISTFAMVASVASTGRVGRGKVAAPRPVVGVGPVERVVNVVVVVGVALGLHEEARALDKLVHRHVVVVYGTIVI